MQAFDNPKKHEDLKKFLKPKKVICPNCNEILKNYTAIGGAICWSCKKVLPVSGMIKW